MANRISKNQEQLVVDLYQEGKTVAEVATEVNISNSSVIRVLERNGIERRSKGDHKVVNKFSDELEKEIVRLYIEENKNTNEIAAMYKTYNTSIRRVLLRNNIEIRTYGIATRIIELEDIKSKEGTPDFDYFLGLLATDGCLTGNAVVLDFSEENKELLDYWNEFLGNKCNITTSIHKIYKVKQYRIAFSNPEVIEYFKKFGLKERKTFDLQLSYINWDVLRGIIDGDGCILSRNHDTTVTICITSGCKKFLEQIQKFYSDNGITSYLKASYRNKNVTYDIFVHKSDDVLKIYNNLYQNAHFFLKRKELKFGSLLKKFNRQHLVNSREEMSNSNLEPSLNNEEGVETLH